MVSGNEYFEIEDQGLAILRLKAYHGVALAEIAYAQAVVAAIETLASKSTSVLLVCVPEGNFGTERIEQFWNEASHASPDVSVHRSLRGASNLPLQVLRLENGVVKLLRLLQTVALLRIITVEGNIDFDLLGLLLAFDVRFCSRTSVFENRIPQRGVTPGFGIPWYLARHVGQATMLDLVLHRRSLSADEALQLGLVSYLADAGNSTADAIRYAQHLAEGPGTVLRALAKAAPWLHRDFESYLEHVGGGFTELPPG